ncbi:MAG: sigma-70 family RNA polymerase sigma factor [Anaerolineales bacterium]|nr:sigma-70 family RNA polymerase sigma factor [Anaerolineales bacterium]
MNEETLLKRLRVRDPEAFQYLFETTSDKLYRVAVGLLRDEAEAEGVVQDTFLRLFEKLDQFEGRSKVSTWLYRVAYNLAVERLRKQRPTLSIEEEPENDLLMMPVVLVDWGQWPERLLTDAEVTAELDKAIAALPETYRAVFLLREVEGLSTEETAVIAGISTGAVKVRLHRARLFLREQLAESLLASV